MFKAVYTDKSTKEKQVVALKTLDRTHPKISREIVKYFEGEISVLQAINHPNIVKFVKFEKTKEMYFLGIEFCNGGTLGALIKKFGKLDNKSTRLVAKQLAAGLQAIFNI